MSVCWSHPGNQLTIQSEVTCQTTKWEEGRIFTLGGGKYIIYYEQGSIPYLNTVVSFLMKIVLKSDIED